MGPCWLTVKNASFVPLQVLVGVQFTKHRWSIHLATGDVE